MITDESVFKSIVEDCVREEGLEYGEARTIFAIWAAPSKAFPKRQTP